MKKFKVTYHNVNLVEGNTTLTEEGYSKEAVSNFIHQLGLPKWCMYITIKEVN